jgi:hypothetical protein
MKQWMARIPEWMIALGLIIAVLLTDRLFTHFRYSWQAHMYLHYAAVFLPGAVRRWNWRDGLLLAAVAGITYSLDDNIWRHFIPYPLDIITWWIPVVGLCNWMISPARRASTLIRTLIFTSAVAVIVPSIDEPLRYMQRFGIPFEPHAPSIWARIGVPYLAYWLLISVLTWLAIPAAVKIAERTSRIAYSISVMGVSACAAWFIVFFEFVVFRVAQQSVVSDTPFDRNYSVAILELRQSPGDFDAMWRSIAPLDWSQPPRFVPDYRQSCVDALARHDPPATARRLSEMLRQKPGKFLAEAAAPVLAQEHRYETAPELMRYALLDSTNAVTALDAMNIPQAAAAILHDQAASDAWFNGKRETADSTINPARQRSLAKLLGRDVGPRWGDWLHFYDQVVNTLPTPLSAEENADVNRVSHAIANFTSIHHALQQAGLEKTVPAPNLDVPGTTALVTEIETYLGAAEKLARP